MTVMEQLAQAEKELRSAGLSQSARDLADIQRVLQIGASLLDDGLERTNGFWGQGGTEQATSLGTLRGAGKFLLDHVRGERAEAIMEPAT